MSTGYRVQSWTVDSGFRPAELRERYTAEGSDGVFLRIESGFRLDDVEFLVDFPGLRNVEIAGPVADDTAAFRVPALEELYLLTNCQVPVPAIPGPAVARIGIDDRPGKQALAGIPGLRELFIWSWDGPDFTFLGHQPRLWRLHAEGRQGFYSLQGLELCTALVELSLPVMRVRSLAPIRGLRKLRRLRVHGIPQGKGSSGVLDLADLSGSDDLEELTLTFGGSVESVGPLAALRKLGYVQLRGTTVVDADLAPLAELAERAAVVVGPED